MCVYAYVYVCMYIYIYMHIYMYIYNAWTASWGHLGHLSDHGPSWIHLGPMFGPSWGQDADYLRGPRCGPRAKMMILLRCFNDFYWGHVGAIFAHIEASWGQDAMQERKYWLKR